MSHLVLPDVVQALTPLEDKYYELGVQLKLEPEHLKRIESQYDTISRRLHETIVLWQHNANRSDCRWSTLARAVERIGGHAQLAERLRERDHGIEQVAKCENERRLSLQSNGQQADDKGYSSSASNSPNGSETEFYYNTTPGCGCGKCSLYMVSADKCPHPADKNVPILRRKRSHSMVQNRFLIEEDDAIEDFEKKTSGIRIEFGKFVTRISRSFKDRGVGIHELTLFLQTSFPVLKAVSDELDRVTCIEQVFKIVVKQACSWFDYDLMKEIIEFLGNSEDKKLTKEYEAQFKKYAEERLPKGKQHIAVGDGVRKGGKQLVIKIDKEWDKVSFSDIDRVRSGFASIFRVRRRELYLADIREGCIELTFMITKEVAERLFLKLSSTNYTSSKLSSYFTASQIKSLKNECVILLTCGDVKVNLQTEEEPEIQSSGNNFQLSEFDWCITGQRWTRNMSTRGQGEVKKVKEPEQKGDMNTMILSKQDQKELAQKNPHMHNSDLSKQLAGTLVPFHHTFRTYTHSYIADSVSSITEIYSLADTDSGVSSMQASPVVAQAFDEQVTECEISLSNASYTHSSLALLPIVDPFALQSTVPIATQHFLTPLAYLDLAVLKHTSDCMKIQHPIVDPCTLQSTFPIATQQALTPLAYLDLAVPKHGQQQATASTIDAGVCGVASTGGCRNIHVPTIFLPAL